MATPTPGLLSIVERDGVVALQGELDLATVPLLKKTIEPRCAAGESVMVDVTGLAFVDSTGIGALVGLVRKCRADFGDLQLIGIQNQLKRLITITGLSDFFGLHKN